MLLLTLLPLLLLLPPQSLLLLLMLPTPPLLLLLPRQGHLEPGVHCDSSARSQSHTAAPCVQPDNAAHGKHVGADLLSVAYARHIKRNM